MSPRFAKVFGDLKESPARSALVCIAILIGTAALTTSLGSRSILSREIASSYAETEPAAAVLWLDQVDNEVMEAARAQPGVVRFDARRLVRARAEIAPGEWRPLLLYGVRDFRDQRVATFRSVSGAWPPPAGTLLLERSALQVLHVAEGGALRLRVPGGKVTSMPVSGIVYDGGQAPGWQDNSGYAYVTPETLAQLGLGDALDELRITVDGDRAQAGEVASALSERLSAQGRKVERIELSTREHPHADHMYAMLTLITVFAAMALILSATLAAMVMSGLLARQVRQIGIMKAIGGTSADIAGMYLTYVLVLAIPAVLAGLAIGVKLADEYSIFSAVQLNIELHSHALQPSSLVFSALICLGVPLVAALVPLLKTLRKRAREALQDSSIGSPKTPVARLSFLDRTWTLALRNTFRKPVRLALTLCALALGGAALMTAVNTNAGLVAAVDQSLADRGDNVDVRLLRPVVADELLARVRALPDVDEAEAWGSTLVSIALPGKQSVPLGTERYGLLAPPAGTRMLSTRMVSGRMPTRIGEIAVNRPILDHEPELRLGNEVELLSRGQRLKARVVGLVEEVSEPHIYAAMETFDALVQANDKAGALRIAARQGTEATVIAAVEEIAAEMGTLPVIALTRPLLRSTMVNHFAIMLVLLSIAAGAAIIVGAFSLGTATSLNVLERRREIGVMRAVGARPRTVLRILLAEGATVALLSLLVALGLSLPLTDGVNLAIGEHGLQASVPFIVDTGAIATWAGLVTAITLLACLGPALGVLRQPAREALVTE